MTQMSLLLVVMDYLLILCLISPNSALSFPSADVEYVDYIDINRSYVSRIESILYPNYTDIISKLNLQVPFDHSKHRSLYDLDNPPPASVLNQTLCVKCTNLEYCQALNGKYIEEIYYPEKNEEFGTCKIIDALGARMESEIFGQGVTFRDTPQCRIIVMQYLCLFWGSQSSMYRNFCLWQEDTSNPDADFHKISPRPPCRSFCIQVHLHLYRF